MERNVDVNGTYEDIYGPAMAITDQAEADEYLAKLVLAVHETGKTLEEARRIVKDNLGYYAGYFDIATQQRVYKLFDCEHPFFGRRTNITAQEAFAMGQQWAKDNLEKHKE